MTADVNVTEKVARAKAASHDRPVYTIDYDDARTMLSALADPDVLAGIAGVHVEHRTDYDEERREAGCECGWLVMVHPDYAVQVMADHTAAAVVEWLRGRA